MQNLKTLLIISLLLFGGVKVWSQNKTASVSSEIPYFTYGKGLGIQSPDSLFLLNIRFRIQNRVGVFTNSHSDFSSNDIEARIRRLRLRFDGFVYNPKFTYVIQLSFSRGDWDYEAFGFPNVIRDAMIFYAINKKLTVGMGQTKLPGNRQRVISSGDQQFPDRSIVNAYFNIDRDFGVQIYYNDKIGKQFNYVLRGAVSSGEGRNFNETDNGLSYTGRIEFLPLGLFKNGGDYFESDLEREPKPKLSIGLTANYNARATRAGGQLGEPLYEARDFTTYQADMIFKYRGFSILTEFMQRNTDNPITVNDTGAVSVVKVGNGLNFQCSYLFKNNHEIALRYSTVNPYTTVLDYERSISHYALGWSKYLRGHRVKIQSDLIYQNANINNRLNSGVNNWQMRFQVEVGI